LEGGFTCDTSTSLTTCRVADTTGSAAANAARQAFYRAIESITNTAPVTTPPEEERYYLDVENPPEVEIPQPPTALERIEKVIGNFLNLPIAGKGGGELTTPTERPTPAFPALRNLFPTAPKAMEGASEQQRATTAPAIPLETNDIVNAVKQLVPTGSPSAQSRAIDRLESTLSREETVTRAQAVRILLQSAGIPIESGSVPFRDVAPNAPDRDALATAARLGLMTGDRNADGSSRGTVRPNDPITKAEFSTILQRIQRVQRALQRR
jgi:hypothetical protein